MKRILSFAAVLIMLFAACSCDKKETVRESYSLDRNFVTEDEENGFTYVVYNDHSEIVACSLPDDADSVEFPSLLGGKPVTVLGGAMLSNNTKLKSAVIPYGVTDIGNNLFSGCTSLAAVSIPDTVRRIGCSAFYGTEWYEGLEGEFVTVGDGVLIKYGGKGGNIEIPENVAYLSDAFSGNSRIFSVTVPKSVFGICDYAFYNCDSMTEIKIPDNMTDIGICILEGTTWLIAEDDEFVTVGDGVLVKYGGSDTDVTVPGNVKYIAGAFMNNTDIVSVTLPQELISAGEATFYGCSSLVQVIFEGDDTILCDATFAECPKLQSVMLPANLKALGAHAFSSCTKLTGIELPESLIYIGRAAFYNCGQLVGITLPQGLKELGASAFFGCIKLESITLPENVVKIGVSAFSCCYGLKAIELSSAISKIPDGAFSYCGSLTEIYLGDHVKTVGKYAFEVTDGIKVYVANDMTQFDDEAFNEYKSVPEIICGSGSAAETFANKNEYKVTVRDGNV